MATEHRLIKNSSALVQRSSEQVIQSKGEPQIHLNSSNTFEYLSVCVVSIIVFTELTSATLRREMQNS